MVWCWLSFRDPSTEPSPIPNARHGADPREVAAPEYPWEAWSGLEVFPPKGFAPILLLPGTDSQHESHQGLTVLLTGSGIPLTGIQHLDLPGKAEAAGLHGDELGADLTQGQGISPVSPKLLLYAFSKCQQNSSVIYTDQQTAFSSSLIIFTLPVTRSCLGRCPWQKLTCRDLVLQMLHTMEKPWPRRKEKAIN